MRPSRQRGFRLARGFHPTPSSGSEKLWSHSTGARPTDGPIVPRHTIVRGAGRLIEDLDGVIESRPSWRARWLLPLAGGALLCVVLATSFVRFTPATVSVLDGARPATGIRSIELPRSLATRQTRLQLSGITGLTTMAMSEGFRDLYRLADGRTAIVIEYPAPAGGALPIPVTRAEDVPVRGVRGAVFDTPASSQPRAIAWAADGMQYQVGGAFSTDELVSLAEQLR